MNTPRPVSEYRCSQSDLYTVCETIANTQTANSSAFENYSNLYGPTTGSDLLSAIANARALPGEAGRSAEHMVLRRELRELGTEGLALFQRLMSYIRDGFPAADYDTMLSAAGHGNYEAAQNENWDAERTMLDDATTFIGTYAAELTGGGMPAAFETTFSDLKTDFGTKHNAFLQAEEAVKHETDKKVMANNKIYAETIRICEDGKRIFRTDGATREEFTFEKVLELVRGGQSGHGVSGKTMKALDLSALPQTKVLLERLLEDGTYVLEDELMSDNDGLFKFNDVVNGKYRLTSEKVGYLSKQVLIVVDNGPVKVELLLEAI